MLCMSKDGHKRELRNLRQVAALWWGVQKSLKWVSLPVWWFVACLCPLLTNSVMLSQAPERRNSPLAVSFVVVSWDRGFICPHLLAILPRTGQTRSNFGWNLSSVTCVPTQTPNMHHSCTHLIVFFLQDMQTNTHACGHTHANTTPAPPRLFYPETHTGLCVHPHNSPCVASLSLP